MIPRQLESLPKARRGKTITLLQQQRALSSLDCATRGSDLEVNKNLPSPCRRKQEGEGGTHCRVLEGTEGRKQGLLWAEQ